MSATMHRALRRTSPDAGGRTPIELVDVDTPRLSPGDALLAPRTVGICGTDWQILRGLREDPARVLGHEGVAQVVEPGATGLPLGSLVTVNPTHPDDPTFLLGHNLPGLWAERTRIPAAAVRRGLVVPLAPGMQDPQVAALAEPLASVLYGLQIALRAARPASLVVWGDGVVGRLALQAWRKEVPRLRTVLVGHGADAIDPDDVELPRVLADLPAPVAVVIATPRTATVDALRSVDRHVRGTLIVDVHAGLPPDPVPTTAGPVDVASIRAENCGGQPWPPHLAHRDRPAGSLFLYGHRGVSETHLQQAARLLAHEPEVFAEGILTHHVRLEDAADFINAVLDSGLRRAEGQRVLKAAIHVSDLA